MNSKRWWRIMGVRWRGIILPLLLCFLFWGTASVVNLSASVAAGSLLESEGLEWAEPRAPSAESRAHFAEPRAPSDGEIHAPVSDSVDLSRIVSIGSAVTETIYALGSDQGVVAVDESSLYPEAAAALPKVPFTRNLSAEGVLSMRPSIILASSDAGPESVIRQIEATGVPLVRLTADESVEGALERVKELGRILHRENEASAIVTRMQQELNLARSIMEGLTNKPTVLFIYARGPNTLMVAGRETSAETMIDLAGGRNAFDSFTGYKPLTAEAVVAANPDVILMMDTGMESVGGEAGILRMPGVAVTNAAKNSRIFSMDGNYLLGFGPRMGEAVLDLIRYLHPQADITAAE